MITFVIRLLSDVTESPNASECGDAIDADTSSDVSNVGNTRHVFAYRGKF